MEMGKVGLDNRLGWDRILMKVSIWNGRGMIG